jgi:hypothetical protein
LKLERTFFILGTFFSFILSWDRFFFSSFGMMHGDPFSNRDNADRLVETLACKLNPKAKKCCHQLLQTRNLNFLLLDF